VTQNPPPGAITYAVSGVDIDAATTALERVKERIQATFPGTGAARPIGHFGGFFRLSDDGDRFLIASADGIGTKLKLAIILGGETHARVGADLVNHCVNDLLAVGASPLFFLDYVAFGKLDPNIFATLVGGMADACRENGIAMIGGETAEMPGLYADGEYDAAGFIVGEVRESQIVDGSAIQIGHQLIGIPSGGLQTNGFSYARTVLELGDDDERNRQILSEAVVGGIGESLGDALMAPHRSFRSTVLPLSRAGLITGMAHITGGGLMDNVPRMLPDGTTAILNPSGWIVPPVFSHLVQKGDTHRAEYHRILNMGIGFVLATRPENTNQILSEVPGATVIGSIVPTSADGKRVLGLD
jgi:phosphoribosylformylglycinamidine cyclo-ligase